MEKKVHNYTAPGEEGAQSSAEEHTPGANTATAVGDPQLANHEHQVIDQAKKEELEAKFTETLSNPRFWAKPSRVKALEDVLVIPVFDDKQTLL